VETHPFGYRSIHYVIKSQPAKCVRLVELQVRTIFEEGWSEIDHKVRYPRQSDDPLLAFFLTIFNRLAGSADEMGTFTKILATNLRQQTARANRSAREIQEKEAELKRTISQLQITKEEKASLQRQIAEINAPPKEDPGALTTLMRRRAVMSALFSASPSPLFSPTLTCSVCGKSLPSGTGLHALATGSAAYYTDRPVCPNCLSRFSGPTT